MKRPSKPIRSMTEPELRHMLENVGDAVKASIPTQTLFLVLITEPGASGGAQYIANANRADCIAFLRETADRLERRETSERTPFEPHTRN